MYLPQTLYHKAYSRNYFYYLYSLLLLFMLMTLNIFLLIHLNISLFSTCQQISYSYFHLLTSPPPQRLSYGVHSEIGSWVPEDLIYFTWLSVSQGSGAGNCHLPIISTKGMFWGQVSVAGLMCAWALQGLPDGGRHTHAPLTLTIMAAGRGTGLIQPPRSADQVH